MHPDLLLPAKTPRRSPLIMVKRWLHRHKKTMLIVTALSLVVTGGLIAGLLSYQQPVEAPVKQAIIAATEPEPEPVMYISPLTGMKVADEATTKRQVTAIMIENSPDARPQSGLKDAGVVYEAIAEGGITRFLALYQESRPSLVGPVRSLRPYYVDWLASYDASVAHVGGSKKALDEIRNGNYKDIDQFFNAGSYYRASDRYAPHNVYTTFDRLDALNQKKGYTSSSFIGFPRKADAPLDSPDATKIAVTISSRLYNVTYAYNKASNDYVRSQGGAPHLDREAGQITPKNIIVMKVPTSIGMEDGYREQMQTIGTGEAFVFRDGTVVKGTWTKTDRKSAVILKDEAGTDIKLNAGQTWVTAIAPSRNVSWQ